MRRSGDPESEPRTYRILGLAWLIALGATGAVAALGIVAVVLTEPNDVQTYSAVTALSTIAATSVGAIAGAALRRHPDHTEGDE